jgi:GNAT superfamily N-acetyltransferase
MIEIRLLPFKKLYEDPNFANLIIEYTEESELKELAPIKINVDLYEHMNQLGVLHVIAAFDDNHMLGFAIITVSPNLHYSKKIAATESFFVGKNYRKSGAGMRLLAAIEEKSKELGATCIFVSAPSNSKLQEVMDKHKGYRETNRIFLKSLT